MNPIEARDLYRFYHIGDEETLALKGVSLSARAGEILAVMGPSGSGKSTLLNCISGLDEPDGGHVEIHGRRITRRSEAGRSAIRANDIGIVMQSKNLIEHLTVQDNIGLKMRLAGKSDRGRIPALLERVGLSGKESSLPAQLSGGEAARAAIAVALAADPRILIADEPTGEVDRETEEKILRLFAEFRANGGCSVIATHSQVLAEFADRIVRLYDGRVLTDA